MGGKHNPIKLTFLSYYNKMYVSVSVIGSYRHRFSLRNIRGTVVGIDQTCPAVPNMQLSIACTSLMISVVYFILLYIFHPNNNALCNNYSIA